MREWKAQRKEIQSTDVAVSLAYDEAIEPPDFLTSLETLPLHPNGVLEEWECLGYDIADQDLLSGLSNCAYTPEELADLRPRFSSQVNEHGLIASYPIADELRRRTDERVPEHAPFFCFALYRIR
jgi:hypothetical protein